MMSVRHPQRSRKLRRLANAVVAAATILTFAGAGDRASAGSSGFHETPNYIPITNIGYALNSKPTFAGTYNPTASYAFNSASNKATSVSIKRNSIGFDTVTFLGLGSNVASNVQVTAFNSHNYCVLGSWGSPNKPDVTIDVFCFDPTGARADTGFTLLYQARNEWTHANSALGFLWANKQSTPSYTPDSSGSFNSTGGTNTITRTGTGQYKATLPNVGNSGGGDVQVTAYYAESSFLKKAPGIVAHPGALRCQVAFWNLSTVDVTCVNFSGNPVDAEFSLLYTVNEPAGVAPLTPDGAYVYGSNPVSTQFYVPTSTWSDNLMGTGAIYGRKTGLGTYVMVVPGGSTYQDSIAIATAVNQPSSYCNIAGWHPAANEIYVR
jgi:hypothetical protein